MRLTEALKYIDDGRRLTRAGWNGPDQWVKLITGLKGMGMEFEPFMVIRTTEDKYLPWAPSQSDMMADDWQYCE